VISGSRQQTLKVWDLHSGEEKFTLWGHFDWVNTVAVTPNSKYVVSGSGDETLKVWDLQSGEEKLTLSGHRFSVNAVAITPNGKYVISGSSDSTLKVWDLHSGEEIASFTGESKILCCAVASDGVTIVAGEASGRLHFLRLEGIEA
jgi:WD40 repeat protein